MSVHVEMKRVMWCGGIVAWVGLTACGGADGGAGVGSEPMPTGGVGVVVRKHVGVAPVGVERAGSSVVLARLGNRDVAIVADADESALHVVELTTKKELATTHIDGAPSQLVMSRDGRIFAALRDRAAVVVLSPSGEEDGALYEAARVSTAEEPVGLALTPDDATLLVTSGWGHRLETFSAALGTGDAPASLARELDVDLPREPRAVVTSRDGARAFVSHVVGGRMSIVDLTGKGGARVVAMRGTEEPLFRPRRRHGCFMPINVRDPMSSQLNFLVPAPEATAGRPRVACQGFALATIALGDRERVLAPQVMVNPGEPLLVSGGYGGGAENMSVPPEAADVGVVDARTGATVAASLHIGGVGMDQRRFQPGACLLPRAAAVDTARGALLVACLGSDKIIEYDAASDNPGAIERRHFDVAAGPTGIAIDPARSRAVVWSELARTLGVLDLGTSGGVEHVALAKSARVTDDDAAFLLGRTLFHKVGDARVSSDGRACASCHPDGRDDGIVWSSPEGPRQTPMLAGRLTKTAPYGWTGSGDSVKSHVTETFARLHGKGLPDADLDALLRYVTTMRAPSAANGAPKLDAAHVARVDRGRHLFKSGDAACASCHAVDGSFTDGLRHDVASATLADRVRAFDTPSLRFVGGTAPYFHDGRYATLHELLVATDGKMGHTSHLTPADLDALEAYLTTL